MRLDKFSADEINSRVYLGDLDSSKHLPSYITHVISLLSEKPCLSPYEPKRKHLFISAQDDEDQDLLTVFGKCYVFIRNALKANKKNHVLIHCRAGRSRSATIATMYLMRIHRWTFDQAEQHLKQKRPIISINDGKYILKKDCYKNARVLLCRNISLKIKRTNAH